MLHFILIENHANVKRYAFFGGILLKKSKKISVLISLVLILLLALSAVSAAEDADLTDNDDLGAIDEAPTIDNTQTTDEINSIDDEVSDPVGDTSSDSSDSADLQSPSEDTNPKNVLKAEPLRADEEEWGTFSELYPIIYGASSGQVIQLNKSFYYNSTSDRNYVTGLRVRGPITIDGQGHTIDGKDASRLLYVYTSAGNKVFLKNINFVNGHAISSGGVNPYGGAIFSQGGAIIEIENCTFINNKAPQTNNQGGAIYVASGNLTVKTSLFENNTAYKGGAIYMRQNPTVTVKGCAFIDNNHATGGYGSNVYVESGGQNKIHLDENWWGQNKGPQNTVYCDRTDVGYMKDFDFYVLSATLISGIQAEVEFKLYSGNANTTSLYPRYVNVTTDKAVLFDEGGYCPEPFIVTFTTDEDATINFTADNDVTSLHVYAGESKFPIEVFEVTVNNVTLPDQPVVTVTSSVPLNYTITVGDQNYTLEVKTPDGENYKDTYQLSGLGVGSYTLMVSHTDDPVYQSVYATKGFKVNGYATELVIVADNLTPSYGTPVTITHTLSPEEASGTITYYIDDSTSGTQLSVDEDFVLIGLSAGEHNITAVYNGDGTHAGTTSNKITLNVAQGILNITIADVRSNYPTPGTVVVKSNIDGKYTIKVNGVDYEVTIIDGEGNFTVQEVLPVGTYDITWDIPESVNYTGATGSASYIVDKTAPEFSISGESEIDYGQTNTIVPTITEGTTGNITYSINNGPAVKKDVGESFTTDVLDAGHYTVVANYTGDANYGSVLATFEFDVLPIDVVVTVEDVEVTYPGIKNLTLTASAPGVYTVRVGTKEYEVTVAPNKVGEAVTVVVTDVFDVGTYNVSVIADDLGDNYNPVNIPKAASYTVNKPATEIEIIVSNFTYGEEATATIVLKQGDTPLEGKNVNITIGAIQDTKLTNSSGEISIPLSSLNAGDYGIMALFEGDENYALAYKVAPLTVYKANATVGVAAEAIDYGEDAKINITLDGVNGEKITGIVKLTVDGQSYDVAVTNGKGTLTVSGLNANEEGYSILTEFEGNDNYNASSNDSTKLVVNKADVTVTGGNVVVTYPANGTVTITSSAPGQYKVRVGNREYTANVASAGGSASVTVERLDVDVYDIEVTADATDNYNDVNTVVGTYTVNMGTIEVSVNNVTVTCPETGEITITASAAGTYTVKVGEDTYTANIAGDGGSDIIIVPRLDIGTYDVSVTATIDNYDELDTGNIATYTVNVKLGTYTDLKYQIEQAVAQAEASGAPYAVLELPYDFKFDEEYDLANNPDFYFGVLIDKYTIIVGKGHTISGDKKARILDAKADINLQEITFVDGKAPDVPYGGAVYFDSNKATIISCKFIENSAECGGALYLAGGETSLVNYNEFTKNTADYGGAVYVAEGALLTADRDSFDQNTANQNGGAIFADTGSLLYVYTSNFTKNEARGTGQGPSAGAVFVGSNGAAISDSIFTENVGADSAGAVYWDGDRGYLTGNFTDNVATLGSGGAVFWWGNYGFINANFTGNKAESGLGGAIAIANNGHDAANTITVNGPSTFSNNKAAQAGAIYSQGENLYMHDAVFTGNEATQNGGALMIEGAKSTVINCNFTSNKAGEGLHGNAIYWIGVDGTVTDCRFESNTGGAGAIIWLDSATGGNITKSYFADNGDNPSVFNIYKLASDLNIEENTFVISNANIMADKVSYVYDETATVTGTFYWGVNEFQIDLPISLNKDGVALDDIVVEDFQNVNFEQAIEHLTLGVYTASIVDFTEANKNNNFVIGSFVTANFIVNPDEDLNVIIGADNYTINETGDLTISVTNGAGESLNGYVTIEIDGVLYKEDIEIVDGQNITVLTGLAVGEHIAKVTFHNPNYAEIANITTFTVSKANVTVEINPVDDSYAYGDEVVIDVTVKNGETGINGTVILTINGTDYAVNITDGTGQTTIKGLENGTFDVSGKYIGNEIYNEATASSSVTVNASTEAIIIAEGSTVTYGTNSTIDLVVIDGAGNPIAASKVNVTLKADTKEYDVIDGSVDLGKLDAGSYFVVVSYIDEAHSLASCDLTVVVNPQGGVQIDASAADYAFDQSGTLVITVKDGEGNPLEGIVNVTIDRADYKVETINGQVEITLEGLTTGVHDVDIAFINSNYTAAPGYTSFTVTQKTPAVTIVPAEDSFAYGADILINVTVKDGDKGVSGSVLVTINGTDYSVELTDGAGQATVKGLSNGTYEATAKFLGNENYTEAISASPATVVVNASTDAIITATGSEVTYGEDSTVTITVTDGAGYPIAVTTVKINDTDCSVSDGVAVVGKLDAGTYTVPVVFDDGVHKSASTEVTLIVKPASAEVTASADDYVFDQTGTLVITIQDGLSGSVNVTIDGADYKFEAIDGSLDVTLENLAAGLHNVDVAFINPNYLASPAQTTFTVTKKTPTVSIAVEPATIKQTENATVKVSLVDGDKKLDGTIVVTVDGVDYAVEVSGGEGSVTIGNLAPANYTIAAKFGGDENYTEASADGQKLEVTKVAKVDLNVTTDGDNIVIKLTDEDGKPVDGKVNVTIDGKTQEVNVTNGVAKVPTSPGNHNVTVVYPGDAVHGGTKVVNNIVNVKPKVVKIGTVFTVSRLKVPTYNKTVDNLKDYYIYVTLKDVNGNVLVGKKIKYASHGKTVTRKTDSKGQIRFYVGHTPKGECNRAVSFIGDSKYKPCFKTIGVKVYAQKVKLSAKKKTFKSSKKVKILTATIKNRKGKALKNKQIIFIVNGKKYKAKSNKKGVATVKVKLSKKKTYKVTVKFAGDNTYKKATKKTSVKIK